MDPEPRPELFTLNSDELCSYDLGYGSMPSNERETLEINLADVVDAPELQMKNIYVQFKHEAPYYMQVENESGNLRGLIIIVEEVQDPNNVNVLFTEKVKLDQNRNQSYMTIGNSSIERDMVVGVQTVEENAPLLLLNKQAEDSLNQWTVENKNASSNAYFSLSKTYNRQTYCAMPSLDASGKISLVLKKKSDTIEQHVFSSPRRTPLAITNFISLPGCTKHTHQTQLMMQKISGLQYLHVNNHDYAVATTDPHSENALFSWTNLAQKDGYLITLEIISKMLGVQRIADGEALELQKPGYTEFNTTIKIEFYDDNAASEHFALCFTSPLNGRVYYVTPMPFGKPLRIYSNPTTDVHVFKIGNITCLNSEGVCRFTRLMKNKI